MVPKVKSKAKPKMLVSEETKELRKNKGQKGVCERKLKALTDKIHQECDTLNGDLKLIAERGYPGAMVQFLEAQIEATKKRVGVAHKVYVDEVSKQDVTDPALTGKVKESIDILDKAHKDLASDYEVFKKGCFLDIKRLAIKNESVASTS